MADKMWAYLIHLSTNMWGDPGSHFKLKPYYPEFHTDEAVWRKVIDFLPEQGFNMLLIDVGDAVQYATHPEIAVRGAWSREKLKSELDYIRSKGLTPIPKLNFSACHDAWLGEYGYMICTKKYYQVCADLIGEIAELFDNPAYLHLGLDEEGLECQKDYSVCHIRIGEQWWHDAFFLFDECAKHGMRPWVWATRAGTIRTSICAVCRAAYCNPTGGTTRCRAAQTAYSPTTGPIRTGCLTRRDSIRCLPRARHGAISSAIRTRWSTRPRICAAA